MLKNIKTIIILFGLPLFFLLSEIFFRHIFNISDLGKISESYLILFLFVLIAYTSKLRLTKIIISILFCTGLIINNIHYEVYQSWINSVNYLLMFKEVTEVTHAGLDMLDKVFPTFIYATFETFIFLSIFFIKNKKKKTYFTLDFTFYALLSFMLIKAFLSTSENITSNIEHARIKSNLYSITTLLGKVLPYELLGLSDIPKYTQATPKIISQPKVKNIILIIGESVSAKHVNYFGYPRETMPFLTELAINTPKNSSHLLFKKTYSAGVLTAISVPALLNAIPYPNGIEQIMKGDTNIFHLARKQNYETFYYTSQPEQEMRLINLMGKNWMQHIIMPTQLGELISRGMNDHRLIPLFEKINLDEGNKFIVLHQRGSHSIYGEYLSESEKEFKKNNHLDNYDSTIHNTDQFIKKIYKILEKRNKDDYVLIYTSDHGQFVTETHYNQGTTEEEQYIVPTFIYSKSNKVVENLKEIEQCNKLFHQQISTFIINTMGFDMPISDCKKGVVYSSLLTGDSGYLEIEVPNKAILVHPVKK